MGWRENARNVAKQPKSPPPRLHGLLLDVSNIEHDVVELPERLVALPVLVVQIRHRTCQDQNQDL